LWRNQIIQAKKAKNDIFLSWCHLIICKKLFIFSTLKRKMKFKFQNSKFKIQNSKFKKINSASLPEKVSYLDITLKWYWIHSKKFIWEIKIIMKFELELGLVSHPNYLNNGFPRLNLDWILSGVEQINCFETSKNDYLKTSFSVC
jgi:hypothetical protein